MDVSFTGLRVLREVAERGSFTAAAGALGYTQSGVSRQIAKLERDTGRRLLDREPQGIRLTQAGRAFLRHVIAALDEIDAGARELQGGTAGSRVRLGYFPSAGAGFVPGCLQAMRNSHPDVDVTTREAGSPALVRALRARTIDVALLSSRLPHRPPDDGDPPLRLETLGESPLLLAVQADGPLGRRRSVALEDLADQRWIASTSTSNEPLLGAWPGMPGRPTVAHTARDWMTKLGLVAAGCGITTVPTALRPVLPDGVHLVEVRGGPNEIRRLTLAHHPDASTPALSALTAVIRREASTMRP